MQILHKRKAVLFFVLPTIALGALLFYLYYLRFYYFAVILARPATTSTQNTYGVNRGRCLGDKEIAEYKVEKKSPLESIGTLKIIVKDRATAETIKSFIVSSVPAGNIDLLEIHRCHVYAQREFNYDPKISGPSPGFSQELWKYDYNGNGKKLITLGSVDLDGQENVLFQFRFRVDDAEKLLTLVRGYSGSQDYAMVIKRLDTLQDVFTLTSEELVKKYDLQPAEVSVGRWISSSTYETFLTDGAVAYYAIVIKKDTWEITILPVPDDASVVTAWNPDGYWIAYNNGPGWIGAEDIAQEIYKQWRGEGKTQSLFVYNLATKQKITLVSKVDPAWSFKTSWISDAVLQYTLPSGATTTYTISQ